MKKLNLNKLWRAHRLENRNAEYERYLHASMDVNATCVIKGETVWADNDGITIDGIEVTVTKITLESHSWNAPWTTLEVEHDGPWQIYTNESFRKFLEQFFEETGIRWSRQQYLQQLKPGVANFDAATPHPGILEPGRDPYF